MQYIVENTVYDFNGELRHVLYFCSCNIEWKKGKNVTQKVVKKKQKKKGKNLFLIGKENV